MLELTRRDLVAAVAVGSAVPLAGCADPSAVLTMEPATVERLVGLAEEVDPGSEEAGIVDAAIANSSNTTMMTSRSPPLYLGGYTEVPFVYDGRYYDVDVERTPVGSDREYLVIVDYVGSDPVDGETPYRELSTKDRRVIDRMLPDDDPVGFEGERVHPYTDRERERSVLVGGERATVAVNGSRFAVTTEQGPSIDRHEYQYTIERVADGPDGFADHLRTVYSFTLTGLGQDERAIVREAVDGGYLEGSVNDAFVGLARRFEDHRAVKRDDWGGHWIVEYDGSTYHAELRRPPSAMPNQRS